MKLPNYTQLKETVTEIMMTKVTITRLLVIIYYRGQKKITKVQLRDYYRAQNNQSNIDENVTKVQLRDYF